ncbi:hypothetical protein FAZ69_10815 [Trinickia terrae]|uniref:Uncharacterized protein n=1 Tax=Trinickia terrae TaxID=2571161 RepID=A0A4U1I844_9BURK|nr:hypothetical protein [Trinickia terrae]TKC89425.1 hypothetical protein FAZ69_10815 [Trinickia terrae]
MIYLGPYCDSDYENRKHTHLFWRSVQIPIYVSVRNPRMFDPARCYCFGTHRHFAEVSSGEVEDITRAMKVARMAFLRSSLSTSDTCFDHDVRALLARLDDHPPIWQMDTRQVAQAVLDAVKRGDLIFEPDHADLRACVKAIQESRKEREVPAAPPRQSDTPSPAQVLYGNAPRVPQNLDTPSYSPKTGTPLGDAQPFQYSESVPGGDVQDLAARSVSEADEAECFAQYERDLDLCNALGGPMGGARGSALCKQQAFQNYQQCRGY